MYLNNKLDDPFTISGVMADFPSNSHLDYDFLITLTDVEFGKGEQTRWLQSNYTNYLQVAQETNIAVLETRITKDILGNYLAPALKEAGEVMAETIEDRASLKLQPLTDIHLYSADIRDRHIRGDIRFIWLFGFVALFILLIACINFINLSTAKSANRAKEVGLRKVLGSGRKNLIGQFLTESTIISLLSIIGGMVMAYLLLPFFNQIAGTDLQLPFRTPGFYLVLGLAAVLIGLLAGSYPSLYLSSFDPISTLKGKIRQGSKSSGLRSSLVGFSDHGHVYTATFEGTMLGEHMC
jgi:putative ABC transport system permease protein